MSYTCHNHEPKAGKIMSLMVQNGWTPKGHRVMELHHPKWADIECGHITSSIDSKCDGCRWKRETGQV